jgi:hydrogenase maturation protease
MSILVIGYGNTLRSDDGAGVALAKRLVDDWQGRGIAAQALTVMQLVPELAFDIAADDVCAVVFVDAAASEGANAVQVRRIEGALSSPSLGHQLDPAALLLYAHLIAKRTVPAWLVTVPGINFGHGETTSPVVQRLVATAPWIAERLQREIERSLCMNLPLRKN